MKLKWIYTARDTGERFAEKALSPVKGGEDFRLFVFPGKERQKIYGFGGAFTDTAAMALFRMEESIRKKAVAAYFDPENGLGYNMGRVPIGCCDFSSVPYSHAEVPQDRALSHYSIAQDKKGILPLIHMAKELGEKRKVPEELLLYALPWSPPGWMKSNGEMSWGGKLLPDYYGTMADYLIRFIRSYEKEGVSLWGLAAQNEPVEVQRWASCEYTGEEEGHFLAEYLIPALEKAGYGDIKLLCWDCNKDFMRNRARELLADDRLRNKIFGVAFHWYSGDYFEELQKTHEEFPEISLLATESCVVMPENLADWSAGERYGHEIIGDLNSWTCAYLDWNLFLDQNSGPGIADNPCAAPVILDNSKQEMIKMSSYYYIGHFSRYIRRGAAALERQMEGERTEIGPEGCAFRNPDGSLIVVLMNRQDAPLRGTVMIEGEAVQLFMDPHSIGTLLVEGQNKIRK